MNESVEVAETPQPAVEEGAAQVSAVPIQVTASEAETEAKAFIYLKESSNRLEAQNSSGCMGLGQDCNGQLVIDCPDWKTNHACQDAYWERYMTSRYGTWVAAKAHWQARVPINGQDVGHWW